MNKLSKYFIRGVMTLLPAGLTLAILYSFLIWTEDLSKSIISVVSEELYFPGLGLVLGAVLICFLGYLTTLKFTDRIFLALELPFKNVPIIKSIYSAFKSLSDYFSGDDSGTQKQQVVVVRVPNFQGEFIGLVTRKDLRDMPAGFTKEQRVAIFIPLSYMIGGFTMFVPRSWVTQIDMRVEDAMKSSLTAWMPVREKNNNDDETI